MKFSLAAILVILTSGCGGGGVINVVDDPAQDALDDVKQSISEALASVQVLTAPPPQPVDLNDSIDLAPVQENAAPLPAALSALVRAAQQLVTTAAGKPNESDSQAILTAAQELESKAKTGVPPATIEQGLQALLAKVNELRQKR
jgi:hypothetical protein